MIPALLPLLVAIAIGLTLPAARRLGTAIGAVLLAYSLGFCIWASFSPDLQRPDWDAVAAEIGEPQAPRATVTWVLGEASLRYYLSTGAIQVIPAEGYDWLVHEIDFVSDGKVPPPPRGPARARLPRNLARGRRPPLHPPLRAAGPGPGAAAAAGAARAPISISATPASSSTASARLSVAGAVTSSSLCAEHTALTASLICLATLSLGIYPALTPRNPGGEGMSKTTATRATDIYETARENPYVQRLIEDDELRDSLRDAFEAAKGAYGRATGNSKGPVKAVTSDKKVQKDLREAAESLREASERLRKPPKRKGGIGRFLLVADRRRRDRPGASARAPARPCSTPSSVPKRSSSTPAPPASTAPSTSARAGVCRPALS